MFQSTHPHEVRRAFRIRIWGILCFNPRTHTRCDYEPFNGNDKRIVFQSTHPHEVRPIQKEKALEAISFNPRTHTRCDNTFCAYKEVERVSIHAPTRGATFKSGKEINEILFQSTHPHEVRHWCHLKQINYV